MNERVGAWSSAVLAAWLVASCGGGDDEAPASPDAAPPDAVPADLSVETDGPYVAGTTRYEVPAPGGERTLVVQAVYPADGVAAPLTLADLEDEPRRSTYVDLLAAAPTGCPTATLDLALDVPPVDATFPLVLFSHCHECTRLSQVTTARRLATHGFVVLAVEHDGNTLWNQLADDGVELSAEFLQVRGADVRAVLDAAADAPLGVGAAIDLERVGVFGHSYGAVTAGLVAQDDPRFDAAAALGAPMENPLLPGVLIADLHVPLLFEVAVEDNSITEFGNGLIRSNFDAAAGPAWKLELADAGHWSFSDLVGVVPGFLPGCGDDERQTSGDPFTYLDPQVGRAVAAATVTAFFRATLGGDAGAASYLSSGRPAGVVSALAK